MRKRLRRFQRWMGALSLLWALSSGAEQAPPPKRVAVVVGSNTAAAGREALRYAHDDARNVAEVLAQVGEFAPSDIQVLLDPSPAGLLSALDERLGALRGQAGETLLLFYYSGHANQKALYPGGQELPLEALRQRIDTPSATVRVGIIDACRGGGWTRAKGLRPEAPFEVSIPLLLQSEGSVLIASSSGLENAHEAEALQGSFFTHHLVAGLRGAADQGGDGEVSVVEAYTYARQLTLRDTALLQEGLQHPSFAMNLHGRSDLPLARVRTSASRVELRQSTGPLSIIRASTGSRVLELPTGKRSVQVALRPGEYLLVRKEPGRTLAHGFTLHAGQQATVDEASLQPVPSTELQRKGLAEDTPSLPRNTVTVGLASLLLHDTFGVEYERALSSRLSLYARPGFSSRSRERDGASEDSGELTLGGRYFLLGHAPEGLFVGTEVTGLITWSATPAFSGGATGVSTGITVGYTLLPWDFLALSVGASQSYLWLSGGGSTGSGRTQGFVTGLRLQVGVAF